MGQKSILYSNEDKMGGCLTNDYMIQAYIVQRKIYLIVDNKVKNLHNSSIYIINWLKTLLNLTIECNERWKNNT